MLIKKIKDVIAKLDNSIFKIPIIFLFFLSFVFLRIFLEANVFIIRNINTISGLREIYFVVTHWLFWYITVFFVVFSCFKYVLKIKKDKIVYLALCAVILLIPMIYSFIVQKQANLEYLSFNDFYESIKGIFTLFIFHKSNKFFFPEMIAIILGCFSVSYYFSKNIKKSLINTLAIYFSIPFLCAFIYFCPTQGFCLMKINSFFVTQQFYSFYWLLFSFIYFLLFLLSDFLSYIKNNNKIFKLKYFIISLIIFIIFLLKVILTTNYFFDIIINSLLYFIIFYTMLFIIKHFNEEKYFGVNLFLIFYDIFAINTILLTLF